MSAAFGVIRTKRGMEEGLAVIRELERGNRNQRFENTLITAKLIAVGALARTESRGGHYRTDFPEADPTQAHRTFMTLDRAEALALQLAGAGEAVPA